MLNHENIIKIYENFEDSDNIYFLLGKFKTKNFVQMESFKKKSNRIN